MNPRYVEVDARAIADESKPEPANEMTGDLRADLKARKEDVIEKRDHARERASYWLNQTDLRESQRVHINAAINELLGFDETVEVVTGSRK